MLSRQPTTKGGRAVNREDMIVDGHCLRTPRSRYLFFRSAALPWTRLGFAARLPSALRSLCQLHQFL